MRRINVQRWLPLAAFYFGLILGGLIFQCEQSGDGWMTRAISIAVMIAAAMIVGVVSGWKYKH